ncbi:MAG: fluoride efflux transporter CrcB [Betaproteobacteria bacterium]|nr:fluoride efflux transporter CrcB [Betaproteobacteria bacterium]
MSPAGFAAVGVGAALGAWLRWGLASALNALLPELPLGTLAANLVGGYLIGVAIAVFEQVAGLAPEMRLLIITGFLGGLTTFSTFSAESMSLLTTGRFGWAFLHGVAHLAGSVALTALGIMSVRLLHA